MSSYVRERSGAFQSESRGRLRARVFTSTALIILAAGDALAQSARTPPPKPSQSVVKPAPPARTGPVVAPGQKPPAAEATPAPQSPGAQKPFNVSAPRPAPAPQNVVTVIHRLNGWRLLTWMAAKGHEEWLIDELPAPAEFHTNIVAGVVSDDGRTVMARLPRADAEIEASTMSPMPPGFFAGAPADGPEFPGFTLIRGDGKRVKAKFVGLDASTGLSLLEAAEPLLQATPPHAFAPPAVGQRVRLYAPAQARAPMALMAPPAAPATPSPGAPVGDVGDAAVVYFSVGETEGRLTEVKRSAAGTPVLATVRASRMTPAWTGAVATSETGRLVGIVGESGGTESQIVPAEAIRLATERVLARRASVPQPWLGVRGDALTKFSLEQFLSKGWPRESALPLLSNPRGVLLTSVAKGAPAALAGLRPGDVISRVGGREVRSVEDFSLMLAEAGAGAKLDFTVLRAMEAAPLKFAVELSGTNDPAGAMEAAEAMSMFERAARPGRLANPLAPFGLTTVGLTSRSAARLGAGGGQFVVTVHEDSPASRAGLRPGDVIETVNSRPLTRLYWRRLSEDAPSEWLLGVVRGGQRIGLKLRRADGPEKD